MEQRIAAGVGRQSPKFRAAVYYRSTAAGYKLFLKSEAIYDRSGFTAQEQGIDYWVDVLRFLLGTKPQGSY
jgi:hypothetical protein